MNLPIQTSIDVKGKEELDAVLDYLKRNSHGEPIFIIRYENSYRINFSSDDSYSGLFKHLSDTFNRYVIKNDIHVGVTDVRIRVLQIQFSTGVDYWEQPPATEITTRYFIKESTDQKSQEICPEFFVQQNGVIETYISKVEANNDDDSGRKYFAYKQTDIGEFIQVGNRGGINEFDAFWRAVVQIRSDLYSKAIEVSKKAGRKKKIKR